MKNFKNFISIIILLSFFYSKAQQKPTFVSVSDTVIKIAPLNNRINNLPKPSNIDKTIERQILKNTIIPNKGLPKGNDPLLQQNFSRSMLRTIPPSLNFSAADRGAAPSDPTGAVGTNHYVMAYNFAFKIFDKQGNVLLQDTNLSTLFPNYYCDGDPIVLYDQFANKYLITFFDISSTPNKLLVSISQTEDPLGAWNTYVFSIPGGTPDYPKYSIWSDGYYITLNKDGNSANTSQVVFVINRNQMITGSTTAQIQGFPLPNISINSFYSPAGFNVLGYEMPPIGNAPIIYLQDDAWTNVNQDHLKIWNVNVDWTNPNNSNITLSQQLNTTAFNSNIPGNPPNNPYANLPQPNGVYIDALQETMMFMTNYRRFSNHNSAVLNFVVNTNGNGQAGIRWFELRQTADGQPWSIYQEGTFIDPSGNNTFCGSISLDWQGNIALGYTITGNSQVPALRYTGRHIGDPSNQMTITPFSITTTGASFPNYRYGDYAQMTIDPMDDSTFWFISEWFTSFGTTQKRIDQVVAFQFGTALYRDLGVTTITQPVSGNLSIAEQVSVLIQNYGNQTQYNFPIQYTIDNNNPIVEYVSSITPGQTRSYNFIHSADLSIPGHTYNITASTILHNDVNPNNNYAVKQVTNTNTGNIDKFNKSNLKIKQLNNRQYIVELNNIFEEKNIFISLYSIDGKQLLRKKMNRSINGYNYYLDLSNFTKGIYLFVIENDKNFILQKVSVE